MSADDLVSLDEAAAIVGITVEELRQLHGDRLLGWAIATVAGVRFRRSDVEALPPMFEPVEEWTPETDAADGTQAVEV